MAAKRPRVPSLRCPKCKAEWSVARVFDACDVSWPNQRWLGFDCAKCEASFHVELETGRVSIGVIDGAPGPAFFPDNGVDVPGLSYAKAFGGIKVTLGTRKWYVKGKR